MKIIKYTDDNIIVGLLVGLGLIGIIAWWKRREDKDIEAKESEDDDKIRLENIMKENLRKSTEKNKKLESEIRELRSNKK